MSDIAAAQTHPRIVGIGASAGGLEALEQFFGSLPSTTGLAFVVIQHLSPDFKSLMTELLSRHTKMPIKRVDDTETLAPNHVYLIPPKKLLEIRGSTIAAVEFDHAASPPRAIDHFFLSLVQAQGKSAIGVILSGTGSDGTAGAAAIREAGGIVIAQDPETCKFDGMPTSVIRKGLAQESLAPEDIAQYLAELTGCKTPDETASGAPFDGKRHLVGQILSLLESTEGVDFRNYRATTLMRRIERRMQSGRFSDLESYLEFLRTSPEERSELQNEFLIGVTRFFRDETAFEELRDGIIPQIVDQNAGETIRIWVAACSTGEEAVTIAILFWDYLQLRGKHCEIKIFATDIDRKAIEYASTARYSESQVIDIAPETKRLHFHQDGEFFELKPHIRRMIIYSVHNVIKDPPFTKLDLLSCRNLLIYFQPALQERCISLFLFALKPLGVLFLGKSEALAEFASEFDVLSSTHKIFRKHADAPGTILSEVRIPTPQLHASQFRSQRASSTLAPSAFVRESQINRAYETLLDQYVPPCLLMDEKDQLIHVFGAAGDLLRIPPGKTTLDVMKLLPKELALALRSASTLALSSQTEVELRDVAATPDLLPGTESPSQDLYTIRVRPMEGNESKTCKALLVFFSKQSTPTKSADSVEGAQSLNHPATVSYQWNQETQQHIQTLEDHLKSTKETLQTAIEELETTNEELQSTNEELMSSNEELQSSNEELHSVNEELYTVNTEYQNKIAELSRANLDIDFLLQTSRIGVIFLGPDLRVRRFNDNVREMISLMPHDIGRPLTELQFSQANKEIMEAVLSVARNGRILQFELPCRGCTQLVTISQNISTGDGPYIADAPSAENIAGLVISFVDITASKISEMARQKHVYAEAMNTQLLSEIFRAIHVDASDDRAPLVDLRRKLSVVGQMIEKTLERKRLNQSADSSETVATGDVVRRILDMVPGSSRIKVPAAMPQLVTSRDIFEDLFRILCRNIARVAATKDVEFSIEPRLEETRCCFDFICDSRALKDLDLRTIFSLNETPLQSDPVVDLGFGAATLHAQFLGGQLEVVPSTSPPSRTALRLCLPGFIQSVYPAVNSH